MHPELKDYQLYVIYVSLWKLRNDKYTTMIMMGIAPFCTYKLLYALLNISLYKRVFVSIFKQYLTDSGWSAPAASRRKCAMRNPARDQINAYLPPDTPATALWRSDHTPPQKPSLSDVKDKLQHPAARGPERGTGRHPSSAFTPDHPCVLRENFQLRSPCV